MKAAKRFLFLTRMKNPETRGLMNWSIDDCRIERVAQSLNPSILQSLNIDGTIHDPDDAGLSGPRVQLVDRGLRGKLSRPACFLENVRRRRGRGIARRNVARLHGFALRPREGGRRRRPVPAPGAGSVAASGLARRKHRRGAGHWLPSRFCACLARARAHHRETRRSPREGRLTCAAARRAGMRSTAASRQAARSQVLAHGAALLGREGLPLTLEPDWTCSQESVMTSPRPACEPRGGGPARSSFAAKDPPRVEEVVAHRGFPAVEDARDLARVRSSISRRTKAASASRQPSGDPLEDGGRIVLRGSRGLVAGLALALRTRCSVAVWAFSRLREDLKKSIDRFVAIL